ncbi:hypothetical protein VPHK435_0005 [Vibrio phage K435]
MKHVHYDKIVAKAANMELVVFCKGVNDGCEWHEVKRFPNWQTNASYFLCPLQNKEACLHWLSGGAIEVKEGGHWETCGPYAGSDQYWSVRGFLMNDEYEYRIKPKKEKRWIATFPWSGNDFYVTPESFASEGLLNDYVDMHYGRRELMVTHEIEVEV